MYRNIIHIWRCLAGVNAHHPQTCFGEALVFFVGHSREGEGPASRSNRIQPGPRLGGSLPSRHIICDKALVMHFDLHLRNDRSIETRRPDVASYKMWMTVFGGYYFAREDHAEC